MKKHKITTRETAAECCQKYIKNLQEQNKKLLEDKTTITQRIKNRRELIADLRKELKAIKMGKPYSRDLFGIKTRQKYVRIEL